MSFSVEGSSARLDDFERARMARPVYTIKRGESERIMRDVLLTRMHPMSAKQLAECEADRLGLSFSDPLIHLRTGRNVQDDKMRSIVHTHVRSPDGTQYLVLREWFTSVHQPMLFHEDDQYGSGMLDTTPEETHRLSQRWARYDFDPKGASEGDRRSRQLNGVFEDFVYDTWRRDYDHLKMRRPLGPEWHDIAIKMPGYEKWILFDVMRVNANGSYGGVKRKKPTHMHVVCDFRKGQPCILGWQYGELISTSRAPSQVEPIGSLYAAFGSARDERMWMAYQAGVELAGGGVSIFDRALRMGIDGVRRKSK